MKNIVVITGGGSGMGLEAAKLMDKDSHIILVGRTPAKLQSALDALAALGLDAEALPHRCGHSVRRRHHRRPERHDGGSGPEGLTAKFIKKLPAGCPAGSFCVRIQTAVFRRRKRAAAAVHSSAASVVTAMAPPAAAPMLPLSLTVERKLVMSQEHRH